MGTLARMAESYARALRAENKAETTVRVYLEGIQGLAGYVNGHGDHGGHGDIEDITTDDVRGFIGQLVATRRPNTALNRYRALKTFFSWAVTEGEISSNPMERMRPPRVPETPVEVLTDEQLKRLFATCLGKSFIDRRDQAILRLFAATGMRLDECYRLKVVDLDLDDYEATVLGKGRRLRTVPFSKKTGVSLDRYLRSRESHEHADEPWMWLSGFGRLSYQGLIAMIRRRGRQAGVAGLHPHQFRHTFAHVWLSNGGTEGDLMRLCGWRSRQMLSRYGAVRADERAKDAYRKLAPTDSL